MLKPTHKLLAGGLLAFTLVAVSLLAGGVSIWAPAALAQGTIPPAPGNNDQGNNDNSQNNSNDNSQNGSNGSSSQDNSDSMKNGMSDNAANSDATESNAGRVSSPEQPLAYSDQWMTIQPGEWQWFAFKYSYDRSRNSDDDKCRDGQSHGQFGPAQ